MPINPIDSIAETLKGASTLIKTIHNPQAKREAQIAAQKLANEHEIDLEKIGLKKDEFEFKAETQAQTQEAEATKVALASRSWFVAGARPAMVWVGVISLFCNFVVLPILSLTPWLEVDKVKDLQMQAEVLWPIISGTGIVAVARSHDKWRKVADQ